MAKRGRKVIADNVASVAGSGLRPEQAVLTPCQSLTKPERDMFDLIVRDHCHLRHLDSILLTTYVVTCVRMLNTKDVSDFEKLAGVAMSLAVKLRLTPSSVMEPRTLGRRYADAAASSDLRKPWETPDPRDIDDDDDNDRCVWTDEEKKKWPHHPHNPDNKRD